MKKEFCLKGLLPEVLGLFNKPFIIVTDFDLIAFLQIGFLV